MPSETPLSDRIAAHVRSGSEDDYARFYEVFVQSKVGVHAIGPRAVLGEAAADVDVRIPFGVTPDGRGPFLLVSADPRVFATRFGGPYNADINGRDALAIAAGAPECLGVVVNSATSVHCLVIDRARVLHHVAAAPAPPPWWRRLLGR